MPSSSPSRAASRLRALTAILLSRSLVGPRTQEGAAPPARPHARYATIWEQQPDKTWAISHSLVNDLKP